MKVSRQSENNYAGQKLVKLCKVIINRHSRWILSGRSLRLCQCYECANKWIGPLFIVCRTAWVCLPKSLRKRKYSRLMGKTNRVASVCDVKNRKLIFSSNREPPGWVPWRCSQSNTKRCLIIFRPNSTSPAFSALRQMQFYLQWKFLFTLSKLCSTSE